MKGFGNLMKRSLVVVLALAVLFPLYALAEPHGKLIIFHAGSLTVPLAKMEKVFEAKYPKVDVLREAGGSTKMARMISELHKPADIMGSADFRVTFTAVISKSDLFGLALSENKNVYIGIRTSSIHVF